MKRIIFFSTACFLLITVSCKKNNTNPPDPPVPGSLIKKQFGGTGDEYISGIAKSPDGSYFLCGSSNSSGFATGYHAGFDAFIIKTDASGNTIWKKFYGSSLGDYFARLGIAPDGNIIAVGNARANDGDITGYNGGTSDGWVIKINSSNGNIIWSKVLGGASGESFSSVSLQADGTIIATGGYSSTTGTAPGYYGGSSDIWVVKLDASGNILWNKNFGGSNGEYASDIVVAANKIYVTGQTGSNNGDVSGSHGQSDVWVFSLDQNGSLLWQKALGGTNNESADGIKIMDDGNLMLLGYTRSNNGDATANYGDNDAWAVKINSSNGTLIWQKNYGGTLNDYFSNIFFLSAATGVFVGYSKSNDNNLSGNKGDGDVWVLKYNLNDGSIISSKLFGGELDDYLSASVMAGSKVILGIGTNSLTGDFPSNTNYDIWLYEIE